VSTDLCGALGAYSGLHLSRLSHVIHVDDRASHLRDLALAFGCRVNDHGRPLPDDEMLEVTAFQRTLERSCPTPPFFWGVHYIRVAEDEARAEARDAPIDGTAQAVRFDCASAIIAAVSLS
jgi:hypothetical protein